MNKPELMFTLMAAFAVFHPAACLGTPNNPNTDWFHDAKCGVFMHYYPGNNAQLSKVNDFDTAAVGRQLQTMGARYFIITLGQNSGFYISPNSAYDRITGYAPGERCSRRDLPADLYAQLHAQGIRLMLYLPCQAPNQDPRAQAAFGLAQGTKDQRIDLRFADKWATVIQEWSDRYGDKVAGWWFDGGYAHVGFNQAIAAKYAAAVKHGNPKAIVTFNPGVRLIRYTQEEDYTAGELNEPFKTIPSSRWLQGSQWHALTFIGKRWNRRDVRYPDKPWIDWVRSVTGNGGVVTLDMGPNWDPPAGPIGSFDPAQVKQVTAILKTIGTR